MWPLESDMIHLPKDVVVMKIVVGVLLLYSHNDINNNNNNTNTGGTNEFISFYF